MLLIYHNEPEWNALTEAERQEIYREYRQLREELIASKQFLDGNQLEDTTSANTVRVRDSQPLITDGPFAETREQLGGFFLIEAKDITEASSIAAKIPSARTGSIEIRPIAEKSQPVTA